MAQQGQDVELKTKTRSNIEIGGIFAIVAFIVGLSFNAGIQYAYIAFLRTGQQSNTARIKKLEDNKDSTTQSLTRLQVLMEQVRADQLDIKHQLETHPRETP